VVCSRRMKGIPVWNVLVLHLDGCWGWLIPAQTSPQKPSVVARSHMGVICRVCGENAASPRKIRCNSAANLQEVQSALLKHVPEDLSSEPLQHTKFMDRKSASMKVPFSMCTFCSGLPKLIKTLYGLIVGSAMIGDLYGYNGLHW
jgi:hypothetical protein